MKLEISGIAYLFPFKNLNFCTKSEELTFYVKYDISFIWNEVQLKCVIIINLGILYKYHSNKTPRESENYMNPWKSFHLNFLSIKSSTFSNYF